VEIGHYISIESDELSIVPFSLSFILRQIRMIYSFSVRLSVSEISSPVSFPEVYFSRSMLLIFSVATFIFYPVSLEYFHILLVYFLLSLSYLVLLVFSSSPIKLIGLELSLET